MTGTVLAAHQAQYLPYTGLIRKISQSSIFVFQDDLLFSRSGYQNRNRIRTRDGWRWLTIPVTASMSTPINEVYPASNDWCTRHERIVLHQYSLSPHLDRADRLFEALRPRAKSSLAEIALACLNVFLESAGIATEVVVESTLGLPREECASPNQRLQTLCRKLGADQYLSGTGAREYMDMVSWNRAGIEVRWLSSESALYTQVQPGWVPDLSFLDFLLSEEAPDTWFQ